MKNKYVLSFFIALLILALSSGFCFSAASTEVQCADALYELGLLTGTGVNADGTPIYSLDRVPTRAEAITMLVRLLGKESEAKSKNWETPFTDVDAWAKPYVGYAYNNGLTKGTSATTFGGSQSTDAKQYLTLVLRALGYSDSQGDFVWNESYTLANKIGISSGEYDIEGTFLRGNIVTISYKAVKTQMKGSSYTLLEYLYKNNAVTINTIADVDFNQTRIEFDTVLASVNSQRKSTGSNKIDYRKFQKFLQHKSGEVSISKDELDSLMNTSNKGKDSLSYSEAAADIDLYFRALKYGYGGYYYFGEDKFKAAENQVKTAIEGRDTVSKTQLSDALYSSLSFVRDGHFSINGSYLTNDESRRYEYYYSNYDFFEENGNYYTVIGGEHWYYSGCNNANVEMDLFLSASGNISYRLKQFCPTNVAHKKDLITLTSKGKTKALTITWTLSEAYNKSSAVDYNYFKENGIAYVSVRKLSAENDTVLNQYVNDAKSLKDAKLIIYDLRHNTGGNASYSSDWIYNLTGQKAQYNAAYARWQNYLWNNLGGKYGKETWMYSEEQRNVIDNDIPFIILVDDLCASSGEYALMDAKALNNSIVIGSNSNGSLLCGNVKSFVLPNSGIKVSFSQGLQFIDEIKNIDGMGYEPDIWCNPSDALTSVLNMLENYNLAESSAIDALRSKFN